LLETRGIRCNTYGEKKAIEVLAGSAIFAGISVFPPGMLMHIEGILSENRIICCLNVHEVKPLVLPKSGNL